MSEAQKLLIERCGRSCERHLQMAALAARAGFFDVARSHRENAEIAADVAHVLAVQA